MTKMHVTADEDSEHIDEGVSDMAEMVAERPVRDEHEVASETVAITLIPAVGPEDWDLHVLEGTDISSGLLPSGRIVIGDIDRPDAVLSWSTQHNKPFVHNVWVAEDLRKHGVARILYDAFRRHVNDHVVSVGPWSPGGYETSKALSDEVFLEPPEQWKAKKAAGWRNELTQQDVAGIYELTYKYQMLKQEAALGDYGVPTILPDAAYMEFERIKGELSQKLEDAYGVFVRTYDSWIEHHQPGAEEDLSTSIYEHVMHELSLASDYPDLLNVFSEEELREVLAEEVKKHISWASKYEELPQDGTDYATLDPDSMTFAELTALPFTGEGTNRWRPTPGDTLLRPYQRSGFFNDLVSALESHPAIDDIVNDRMEVERDEFYSARQLTGVMAMLEALNDEWEKLPEGLDKDIELFQEALNVAHNNGSMAEYILEVGGQGPDRGAGEFLSDLSENPEHGEKWDKEISRLLGYPVRTRTIPKSDWFVSSRLKRVLQALAKVLGQQKEYPTKRMPGEYTETPEQWKAKKGRLQKAIQLIADLVEESKYLYHVTFLKDLDSIISGGLGFGGRAGDFYAERSRDKLFFTEFSGVSYWMGKLEDRANAETDNPEEGWVPVVLRIDDAYFWNDIDLVEDELGSRDAMAPAVYVEPSDYFKEIAAPEMEIWDGARWVPLDSVDVDAMLARAIAAAEVEGYEDEGSWYNMDFDVFMPKGE